MKDRISQNPNRIGLTDENGVKKYYTLSREDNPTQEGTKLNKATILTDDTANALGLGDNPTINDAFDGISNDIAHKIGSITVNPNDSLGNNWLKCDGRQFDARIYEKLAEIYTPYWETTNDKTLVSSAGQSYAFDGENIGIIYINSDSYYCLAKYNVATDMYTTIKTGWLYALYTLTDFTYINGNWVTVFYYSNNNTSAISCASTLEELATISGARYQIEATNLSYGYYFKWAKVAYYNNKYHIVGCNTYNGLWADYTCDDIASASACTSTTIMTGTTDMYPQLVDVVNGKLVACASYNNKAYLCTCDNSNNYNYYRCDNLVYSFGDIVYAKGKYYCTTNTNGKVYICILDDLSQFASFVPQDNEPTGTIPCVSFNVGSSNNVPVSGIDYDESNDTFVGFSSHGEFFNFKTLDNINKEIITPTNTSIFEGNIYKKDDDYVVVYYCYGRSATIAYKKRIGNFTPNYSGTLSGMNFFVKALGGA